MKIFILRTFLPFTFEEAVQLYQPCYESNALSDKCQRIRNERIIHDDGETEIIHEKILEYTSYIPKGLKLFLPKNAAVFREEIRMKGMRLTRKFTSEWINDDLLLYYDIVFVEGKQEEYDLDMFDLTDEEKKILTYQVFDLGEPVEQDLKSFKSSADPNHFVSSITGRGPIFQGWSDQINLNQKNEERKENEDKEKEKENQTSFDSTPIITEFRLVRFKFKWTGLQTIVEHLAPGVIHTILGNGHRQSFCWNDDILGKYYQSKNYPIFGKQAAEEKLKYALEIRAQYEQQQQEQQKNKKKDYEK
ncbi:MAG: hypothetical protein EZS28_025860, partial [Streblomastix strix]